MIIRGRRSKVEQITFEGETHPTCGLLSNYSWNDLKNLLDKEHNNHVQSIRLTPEGLTIFWKDFF